MTCTNIFQLCNPTARANTDLTNYNKELTMQYIDFNHTCKSGQLTYMNITRNTLTLSYDSNAQLVKPGAALHSYSQGLVDNYPAFHAMLSNTDPARLFESI